VAKAYSQQDDATAAERAGAGAVVPQAAAAPPLANGPAASTADATGHGNATGGAAADAPAASATQAPSLTGQAAPVAGATESNPDSTQRLLHVLEALAGAAFVLSLLLAGWSYRSHWRRYS
jgi:hypothetical protein